MKDYQTRVIQEAAELSDKLSKLNDFIQTNPQFELLPTDEHNLLIEQAYVMALYEAVLNDRINLFNK